MHHTHRLFFARTALTIAFSFPSTPLLASTFTTGVSQGALNSPAIVEASGLVASQNNPGVLWTENDSGNPNTLYAIDTTGRLLGSYTLSGATNVDWEDIAIGPGPIPGVSYLYLATIGDSKPTTVFRVPEPAVYTRQSSSPISLTLSGVQSKQFTTGADDGESLFVDPANGDIYLGSKQSGHANFYLATQSQFSSSSPQTLSSVATVPLSKANGADISYDGSEIIVRNQGQFALLYHRSPGQTISQALANPNPDYIPVNGKDIEPNAESIAFDPDGNNFYTISEGKFPPLYKYTRTSNDAPPARHTLLAPGSFWRYLAGGSLPATSWNTSTFNDSSWSLGSGQFGYGHGDEKTTLSYGSNPNQKPPSAFFRTTFNIADPADSTGLTLKLLYDDGAAVYINGHEITRQNLSPTASLASYALAPISDSLQYTWLSLSIDPAYFLPGLNTIAVEIHNSSAADPDLRFDLQLSATTLGADLNGDGVINASDLAILDYGFAHHLTGYANGDTNNDGVINFDDLALYDRAAARYQSSLAQSPYTLLPEPTALISLLTLPLLRPRRNLKAR